MDLIEAVYKRKSTRNYLEEPIAKKEINSFLDEEIKQTSLKGHEVGIECVRGPRIHEVMDGLIGNYRKIIAPHYLILTAKKGKYGSIASGYVGEEIVLKLTANGVGTCWIGKFGDRDKLREAGGIEVNGEIKALIAFGKPQNKLYRDPDEASRKKISKLIINGEEHMERWKETLDAIKYAPSSMNLQPWRLSLKKEKIDLYIKRGGFKNKIINLFGDIRQLNQIDAGIALKHSEIPTKKPEIQINQPEKEEPKYKYIATTKKQKTD